MPNSSQNHGVPDREMLKRAQDFDRICRYQMSRRERDRGPIQRMHDVAKRTRDEMARKLDL